MSELKARYIDDTYVEYYNTGKHELAQIYLKSEADKVIAELKDKLDLYKRGWEENDKVNENLYAQLRHHKYNRCLAMANWCCDACDKWMMRKAKAIVLGKDGVKEYYQAKRKLFLFMRWQTRWLKIAEQFKDKEAK